MDIHVAEKPAGRALLVGILCALVFSAFVYVVYTQLPVNVDWSPDGPFSIGVDWKGYFRVAALKAISGENPYAGDTMMQNPPWILILTIPVALLSPGLGAAVMFVLTFFGYGLACYRLGLKPLATIVFFSFPLLWYCAINGNIDWLVAIGFTLPPQIGLFFVLLKPQLGIGVVIFWLWQAWQKGGLKQVLRICLPVFVAFLISFVVYGLWPLRIIRERMVDPYNASFWPMTAVLGAAMLYYALRKNKKPLAISASPFLTPYLSMHGYAIALLGLGNTPLIISMAAYWAAFLVTGGKVH